MMRDTGQMGVPVIKIGPKWIVGFDRAGIDQAGGPEPMRDRAKEREIMSEVRTKTEFGRM